MAKKDTKTDQGAEPGDRKKNANEIQTADSQQKKTKKKSEVVLQSNTANDKKGAGLPAEIDLGIYAKDPDGAKKVNMLQALASTLGIVSQACIMANVGRTTHYKWLKNDKKYSSDVYDISEVAIDFVESQLFKQIKAGQAAPTIFYLKTKGKHRGYIEESIHHVPGLPGMAKSLPKFSIKNIADSD